MPRRLFVYPIYKKKLKALIEAIGRKHGLWKQVEIEEAIGCPRNYITHFISDKGFNVMGEKWQHELIRFYYSRYQKFDKKYDFFKPYFKKDRVETPKDEDFNDTDKQSAIPSIQDLIKGFN